MQILGRLARNCGGELPILSIERDRRHRRPLLNMRDASADFIPRTDLHGAGVAFRNDPFGRLHERNDWVMLTEA